MLVIDADTLLGRALCDELVREDHGVLAHVRAELLRPFAERVRVLSAARADAVLARWDTSRSPIRHIVFGLPPDPGWVDDMDEAAGSLCALARLLEERLTLFLAELQAAGRLLVRNPGGQIWVLTQESSMRYYMKLPAQPIETLARQAALKSFAKEIFRFGVRANCANVQSVKEQATAEEWQAAREGLKAYAMKFRPTTAKAVAKALCAFLAQPDLPIAGMIVPIGIGFAEHDI